MFNIGDYLTKFNKILISAGADREAVADAILKTLNVAVPKESIKISGDIAYIKTSSIIKNEIFMKKEKILEKIKEILGEKIKISDLR